MSFWNGSSKTQIHRLLSNFTLNLTQTHQVSRIVPKVCVFCEFAF